MTIVCEFDPVTGRPIEADKQLSVKEQTARAERKAKEAKESEEYRQQKRAAIREKQAHARYAEEQLSVSQQAIATVQDRKDAFAAQHVADAEPLQARIRAIEAQQIAAIKSRLPADSALETEKHGLLDQLRAMNAALEEALRREDSILAALETERVQHARNCGTSHLTSELISTGRPDLLAKMRVTQSAVTWAQARLSAAQDKHSRQGSLYTASEVESAQEHLTRAQEEARLALQAVLDE